MNSKKFENLFCYCYCNYFEEEQTSVKLEKHDLPLFLERPEGSFMSRMDAGELDVARTGEQPWQAVGGGEHAPASMCISESASDVIESMA